MRRWTFILLIIDLTAIHGLIIYMKCKVKSKDHTNLPPGFHTLSWSDNFLFCQITCGLIPLDQWWWFLGDLWYTSKKEHFTTVS